MRDLQRVAAEFKKVVIHADRFQFEHFAPDAREQLLDFGRGLEERRVGLATELWLGQGLAVDLAVGGERECVQHSIEPRHHVIRQPFVQPVSQIIGLWGRTIARGDVRSEALVPGTIIPRGNDRFAHRVMLAQEFFDFAEFNSEAANLDLVVDSAEEFDIAIREKTDEVAGPIHARVGITAKRVGQEPFSGQIRPVKVSTRQGIAADVQFAGDTDGYGLPLRTQDV